MTYDKSHDQQWIEGQGRVRRLLADDDEGGRHQRFIVTLNGGQTLLIAHNVDIAPRVPLGIGDRVDFRGLYELNDLGGVLHWTHHDPHGVEVGGYLQFQKRDYR
ncbi:MAG: DUF3465 domain-containing protein [Woeseia sp.]